ncbi:hypothetical protein ACHAWU_007512 [Discostella pseudostelligera]|uniref:Histone chaperone n=1 Tax=Discostella pseudostelligera TaxID=259834 RepID=A0ABD3M769_9STRA
MALVNLVNMAVLNNPSQFLSPFSFEITFECLQPLEDDLEWKVLYVGSAEDTTHDQVLDEILVGPIPVGINKFELHADAPDISQIPENDILGVTVVLVTCSYRDKEFVRVGYYVNNEYTEPYDELVGPPKPLDMEKVRRVILSEKPRVTRFPIQWGDATKEEEQQQQQPPQKILEDGPEQEQDNNNNNANNMSMEEDGRIMPQDDLEDGEGGAEFGDEDEDDDLSIEGQNMMMDDDNMIPVME